MQPRLSLVVPLSTNGVIPQLLESLRNQTAGHDDLEVVVVSAGLTPEPATVAALENPGGLDLSYVESPAEGGRAAAWNTGIARAKGELIGLLADDFVPVESFIAAHLALHDAQPESNVVSVGAALFPAELRRDPFARWLEDSGSLFGVSFTTSPAEAFDGYFYVANAVLTRELLQAAGPVDERFPDFAVDDHELGLRLRDHGVRCLHVPGAAAHHIHEVTFRARSSQMRLAGQSMRTLDSIYPAGHPWNSGMATWQQDGRAKTAAAWVLQCLTRRESDRARYYRRQMRRSLLIGYARA